MLGKKFRKMPRGFADVNRQFGWRPVDLEKILVQRERGISSIQKPSAEIVKELAAEYMRWFETRPTVTHLFPLKGAVFHFWFAKGVRDGMGSKTRLRTIATDRFQSVLNPNTVTIQAKKMKIVGQPVVVHDMISGGYTLGIIEKATGAKVEGHGLPWQVEYAQAKVPNEERWATVKDLAKKEINPKTGRMALAHTLSKKDAKRVALIKRALYAAGVAAAREVMTKTKKQ